MQLKKKLREKARHLRAPRTSNSKEVALDIALRIIVIKKKDGWVGGVIYVHPKITIQKKPFRMCHFEIIASKKAS